MNQDGRLTAIQTYLADKLREWQASEGSAILYVRRRTPAQLAEEFVRIVVSVQHTYAGG